MTAPEFQGHDNRECGEHRTVGPHRAWCHDCGEWCYPNVPCKGCETPTLRVEQTDPRAVDHVEALTRAGNMLATDARDWSLTWADAWLWGLLCGWGCEDEHEHDDVCGGDTGMGEVARLHGWTGEDVARLARYRDAIRRITAKAGAGA